MALALPKSRLYEANASSTNVWQADLKKLFHHARERYSDVVWEVTAEGETDGEEVYGHKGEHNGPQPPAMMTAYDLPCFESFSLLWVCLLIHLFSNRLR
jgi:hypothetical protein